MEQGYKKIFWGLLIVLFNINIGALNILPDFLGYLIISSGIKILISEFENEKFKIAYKIASLLFVYALFLSIFNFIGLGEIIGYGNGYKYKNIMDIGLSIFATSTSLFMGFYILSGTVDLYFSREQKEKADVLVKSQRSYTVLLIIGLILISISLNVSSGIYTGAVAIYVLLVQIYFATIISGIRKTFSGNLIEL